LALVAAGDVTLLSVALSLGLGAAALGLRSAEETRAPSAPEPQAQPAAPAAPAEEAAPRPAGLWSR
jgi:hypothetical protein